MAEWNKRAITNLGRNLIAQAQTQGLPINITYCKTSSHNYYNDDLEQLTSLSDIQQTVSISEKTVEQDLIKLVANLDNRTLAIGYNFYTYGVYANLNGGADVLFLVGASPVADPVPPLSSGVWQCLLNSNIKISNTDIISIDVDLSANATIQWVNEHKLINTTYSALKTLRDTSKLVPGQQYRITDFVTIINGNVTISGTTKTLYRSANHPFDLIVTADSSNTLNENARAIQHSGDTYFANQNLKAWQLKYCLDNDTSRFNWANTSTGKGVIFYLKDERDNECGYDFKNIQMKRFKITAVDLTSRDCFSTGTINTKYQTLVIDQLVGHYVGAIAYNNLSVVQNDIITIDENDFKWFYTFSSVSQTDLSLTSSMLKLKELYSVLPNNVFHSGTITNVSMQESDCINNTFEGNCYRVFIKGINQNNISVGGMSNETIDNGNSYNIFIGTSVGSIGTQCSSNIISGRNINIGHNNSYNILFTPWSTFGNGNGWIQTGNDCRGWNVGNMNNYIQAGDNCYGIRFGNYCGNQNVAYAIKMGNNCYGNNFANYCRNINLGQYVEECDIGTLVKNITIINTTTNVYGHITIPAGCQNLTFTQGANYIVVASSQATNLTIDTTWNNKTISGNTYGTATINSSTGAMSAITNYCYGHRGTAICPDVGIPPTANTMGIGYTCETYETAS